MPEKTDRTTLNILLLVHLLLYVFLLFALEQSKIPGRLLAVVAPGVLPLSMFVKIIPGLIIVVGNLLMFTMPRYALRIFITGYGLQLLLLLNRQWTVVPALFNFTMALQLIAAGMIIAYHFRVTAYTEEQGEGEEYDYRKLVTVYKTGKQQEMMILKSMFEEQGIQVFCKGETLQDLIGLGRMGTGFNPLAGPMELQVGEDDAERARDVVNFYASGKVKLGKD